MIAGECRNVVTGQRFAQLAISRRWLTRTTDYIFLPPEQLKGRSNPIYRSPDCQGLDHRHQAGCDRK